MKSVFVATLLWSLLLWVTVCYLPSRFLYRSELRIFVFQLCVDAITYLLAARAVFFWRTFEPMDAPWAPRAGNKTHQFFVWCFARFFIIWIFALFQAFFMSESNAVSQLVPTPCGASSCSREIDAPLVYHPRGFPGNYLQPTICTYENCHWENSNGKPIQGFNAQENAPGYPNYTSPCVGPACLATDRAQDYPDLAIGNGGGLKPGFGTLLTPALCPGSYVLPTAVKGRAPCSYCLSFFAKHFNYTSVETAYCPSNAADNWVWCNGICPGVGEDRSPDAMLHQSLYTAISTTIFLIVWFVVHCAWFVTHEPVKSDGRD